MGLVATLIGLSLNYEKKLYAIHPEMRKKPTGIHITDFIERRALLPALMMFFTAFSSGAGVYMIVFATDYQFSTVGHLLHHQRTGQRGRPLCLRLQVRRSAPPHRGYHCYCAECHLLCAAGFHAERVGLHSVCRAHGHLSVYADPHLQRHGDEDGSPASGAASSTYWLGFDGGMAVGMLFFGVIIDWGSYPAAFLFAAAYMAIFGIVAFSSCAKSSRCADPEPDRISCNFLSSSLLLQQARFCLKRTLSGGAVEKEKWAYYNHNAM